VADSGHQPSETVYCADCDVTFDTFDEWCEHEAMTEEIGPDESRQLKAAFRRDPKGTKSRVQRILSEQPRG
jgi:hypothetical protein